MDILIKGAQLPGEDGARDIAVRGGVIAEIAPQIGAGAARTVKAEGRVVIPGFVDGHIHLDKAFVANRLPNRSGTLQEAIAVTAALKPTFTPKDIEHRATRALRAMLRHGTTALRAHAEFDPAQGFAGFEAVLRLREKYRDCADIQVAAFPQEGIFQCPGTADMMEEAMRMGADVVGGVPYNDTSATEHIDFVFELAARFGRPIDLHQDFQDDADALSIEYVCDKTISEGYQGRVSVGHLTALAALPPDRLEPILRKISDAQISVMCLPATDLHLGGRRDACNIRRTLTPVRKLRDAGVNVCLATNNIRNAFTPYGNGDLLQIAMLAVPAAHLGGADDLPTVLPMLTENPAKALGLAGYGLRAGGRADLVMLDTTSIDDAVIDLPQRLLVVKNGAITLEGKAEWKTAF